MEDRRRFNKIYFGWWITIVNAIISGIAVGVRILGFSALFKPIASDFGLSRASNSAAAGLGALMQGIMSFVAGALVDKIAPRWLTLTGASVMFCGLVLMNFINSVWLYYVVWGVLITGGQTLAFQVVQDKVVTNWFMRKRGMAIGLRFALMSIIGAILLPVMSWLIMVQGWRTTCLIFAGVILLTLPIAMYFLRQGSPESFGLLPDGAKMESGLKTDKGSMMARSTEYANRFQEVEFTVKEAIRTPTYWMIISFYVFFQILYVGFSVHCIPFLTDRGIDPVMAGSMMAMMYILTVPSQFIAGIVIDRVKKEHLNFLMASSFMFKAVGIMAFLLSPSIITVYLFLIMMGFGVGLFYPMDITIKARYYGRKAYGSVHGIGAMFGAPVGFLAPIYAGWIYDTTGSYTNVFISFLALAVIASILACRMRIPKR